MSEGARRRVTYAQLETLCDFLTEHRDIATGYNKTARARDYSRRTWIMITETLNAHGDGAIKDWKAWSKYWNDYKSKLKKIVASNRASNQRTGGGQSEATSLSDIEKRFLQILGTSFGSGLAGVRVEPFNPVPEQEYRAENVVDNNIILDNVMINESSPRLSQSPSLLRTSQSPAPALAPRISPEHEQEPGPAPALRSPRTPPAQPAPAPAPPNTPRRSPRHRVPAQRRVVEPAEPAEPRRRQRRRREPPMSQETARRTLIDIANERARQDQLRNEVLQQLVGEIANIKELLQTRLPVPQLPETPDLNLP